jgi:hypothetical protein
MSSMSSDQARLIAERIARRVSDSSSSTVAPNNGMSDLTAELSAMRSTLGELQKRLVQIESKVRSSASTTSYSPSREAASSKVPPTHSPWLAGVNAVPMHPSQERFDVEEAVVSELVDFFTNEKTCSVEPGGKPCDHCAMCSSRGF